MMPRSGNRQTGDERHIHPDYGSPKHSNWLTRAYLRRRANP